jgi:predicted nucleic acid-binding protein
MNYYDSSALIKRFIDETGSARVASVVASDRRSASSVVAFAEVHAGLARRLRERFMSAAVHRGVVREFGIEWGSTLQVEVGDVVLQRVSDLVLRHPLRGFDAIHLASAVQLREELGEDVSFVAADTRLLSAAAAEKFKTINVRD